MSAFATSLESWDLVRETDRRFRRITTGFLIPFLILAILIPFWEITGLQKGGGETMETRYVTLQKEAEPAPTAEEPKPEPEEAPKPEKKKETPKVEKPQPTPEQLQQKARAVAQKSGVLAMADQLAALRDNSTLSGFENRPLASDIIAAKSGTGASGGNSALAAQAFAEAAAKESGGIISSDGSSATRRTQSGTGLDARRTTVVQSPIGFGQDKSKAGQSGDKMLAGRTLEEIQLVFDRAKGSFIVIWNRASMQNPNIGAGKVVISLTIAPNGVVTECHVVRSTYNDPDFEAKIVARVKTLNFGAKDVPPFTYPNFPIDIQPG